MFEAKKKKFSINTWNEQTKCWNFARFSAKFTLTGLLLEWETEKMLTLGLCDWFNNGVICSSEIEIASSIGEEEGDNDSVAAVAVISTATPPPCSMSSPPLLSAGEAMASSAKFWAKIFWEFEILIFDPRMNKIYIISRGKYWEAFGQKFESEVCATVN